MTAESRLPSAHRRRAVAREVHRRPDPWIRNFAFPFVHRAAIVIARRSGWAAEPMQPICFSPFVDRCTFDLFSPWSSRDLRDEFPDATHKKLRLCVIRLTVLEEVHDEMQVEERTADARICAREDVVPVEEGGSL